MGGYKTGIVTGGEREGCFQKHLRQLAKFEFERAHWAEVLAKTFEAIRSFWATNRKLDKATATPALWLFKLCLRWESLSRCVNRIQALGLFLNLLKLSSAFLEFSSLEDNLICRIHLGAWHNLYWNERNLLLGRRFSLRYGREGPSCLKTTNSDGVPIAKHFQTPQFDAVLTDWVAS